MEDLIKNLKAYFDSATKEQLEKDWEELEPYSHIGPEIFSFLDELRKKPHKSSVCGMNCVFF